MLIHCTAGANTEEAQYEATIGWFQRERPGNESSAHVVIDRQRNVNISVPYGLIAYHAAAKGPNGESGGYYNRTRLAIEFCKRAPIGEGQYTDEQYAVGAEIIAEMADIYGFPINRETIKGHSEVQSDRLDPGPLFRWDYFMSLLA